MRKSDKMRKLMEKLRANKGNLAKKEAPQPPEKPKKNIVAKAKEQVEKRIKKSKKD